MAKKDKLLIRTVRCKHVHLSGRRCGTRVGKRDMLGNPRTECGLHRNITCKECVSMAQAFGLDLEALLR